MIARQPRLAGESNETCPVLTTASVGSDVLGRNGEGDESA